MENESTTRRTADAFSGEGGSTIITCDERLDISAANTFYEKLLQAIEAESPIVLDASNIEHIDTVGIQLLCTLYQEARSKGIEFRWQQPSDSFRSSARLLGLEECLELPSA